VKKTLCSILFLLILNTAFSQKITTTAINLASDKMEAKCIAWRRDIHQNPELGNREFRTAKIVADHLRSLGIEVQEKVAHTGVVGILKGGRPGPVVALRADMDALPVVEKTPVSFASKVTTNYNGQEVGVMHACGHDAHVAILMSVAEMLAGMKNDLPGTVKFIFQPAEEGPPEGETGGAKLMVQEGVLDNPKVDVVFGLHVNSHTPVGQIKYREKGMMAAADFFTINIKGKQAHGALPWLSIDPVIIGAQVIQGIQTIISRQTELTKYPAVISTTVFNAGVRENIIPDEVVLKGTIRTLDTGMQSNIWRRLELTVKNIAEASGATAELKIRPMTLVTYNDPELTTTMLPTLQKVTNNNVERMDAVMGAEDFSFFAARVPSLYFYLGIRPVNQDPKLTATNHSPEFYIDESGLKTGIRALASLTIDYMEQAAKPKRK
jgi:amidohydrolase